MIARPGNINEAAAPARWRIDCIVGARPNFVKIAPILRALRQRPAFAARLIHTGQHYDPGMSDVFFRDLGIAPPDTNLEVGSGSGTEQTARVMLGLEQVFAAAAPDLVLVVGDVNSTLAAALVAAKLMLPLVHVEAGLRSRDRTMPEEINRLVTDRLASLLLTTERQAAGNLTAEGVAPEQIRFVGNVMIDSLMASLSQAAPAAATLAELGAPAGFRGRCREGYGLVTLHRPSNVDDPAVLGPLLATLARISARLPLVFALHPRTRATIAASRLAARLDAPGLMTTPPLAYPHVISLMREAKLVITDSGGMQEETTALGVPCLTVRDTTERPITLSEGTNTLVGTDPAALAAAVADVFANGGKRGRLPEYWDGHAALRIADSLEEFLAARTQPRAVRQ